MTNHTEVIGKILSFISRLSTLRLTLVLIFGIVITVTLKPDVLEIALQIMNQSATTS